MPFDPIIRTPQNPKLYRLASLLDPLICWERQKLTSNEALSCEISRQVTAVIHGREENSWPNVAIGDEPVGSYEAVVKGD